MSYTLKLDNGRKVHINELSENSVNEMESRYGSTVCHVCHKNEDHEVPKHALGGFVIGAALGTILGVSVQTKKMNKEKESSSKSSSSKPKLSKGGSPKQYLPNGLVKSIDTTSKKRITNKDIVDGVNLNKSVKIPGNNKYKKVPKDLTDKPLSSQANYLPKRQIASVNTTYGRNFKREDIVDGAYIKKGVKYAEGGYIKGDDINPKDYVLIKASSDVGDITYVVKKSELQKIPRFDSLEDKASAFIDVINENHEYYNVYFKGLITDAKEVKDYVSGYNHSAYYINPLEPMEDDNLSDSASVHYGFYITNKPVNETKYSKGGNVKSQAYIELRRKKYVLVDPGTNMLWANEYFSTKEEAEEFSKQNNIEILLKSNKYADGGNVNPMSNSYRIAGKYKFEAQNGYTYEIPVTYYSQRSGEDKVDLWIDNLTEYSDGTIIQEKFGTFGTNISGTKNLSEGKSVKVVSGKGDYQGKLTKIDKSDFNYKYYPTKSKMADGGMSDYDDYSDGKQYAKGGISKDDTPKIYVADLAAYNEGKLIGEWLDLTDYDDADDLMGAIHELMAKFSKEQGVEREEWAIHDYENIPSNLASEYMGREDFEIIYDLINAADDRGIPYEVLAEAMAIKGEDNAENVADNYYGEYDSFKDFAYNLVDETGISNINNLNFYFDYESFGSDERINMGSEEEEEMGYEDMSDEDLGYELVEQMGGLDNLSQQTIEMYFDYDKFARDLEMDYDEIRMNGNSYIFFSSYKRGGVAGKSRYNSGWSWKMDRAKQNFKETYERPMESRKVRNK